MGQVTRRLAHSMGLAAAAVALALAPATAQAQLDEYQNSGRITPCRYTPGQLNAEIPNDVAQYAPDYADALRAAANQGCGGSAPTRPTDTPTDEDTGVPLGADGNPLPPGSVYVKKPPAPRAAAAPTPTRVRAVSPIDPTSGSGASIPAPVIGLAILLSLMLVAGGGIAANRRFGVGAGALGPLGHAFGEVSERLGGALAGLAERLRAVFPGRS